VTTDAPSRPRAQRQPAPDALVALRNAKDRIDRDFAEPLDLADLAAAAGYSKFHFARRFASAYGETPRNYLTRRRIERAKDLLRGANLSVTEICLLVGFESLGSFSSRFTALVGRSPSVYRREVVAAGNPPPIPGCFLLMWTRPGPTEPHSARSAPTDTATTVGRPTTPSRRTTP
jgi:AraC-like DNA-binding protein